MSNFQFETDCVRAGYSPKKGEPVVAPIVPSVTYRYETTEQVHELFDLQSPGYFYSRIENPTVTVAEEKISKLEGGVGALMTSSGQAANLFAVLNICEPGDNIIAARSIYGGTINLFQHRLKNFNIDVQFIDNEATADELNAIINEKTKLIFTETCSNPALKMTDFEVWAKVANENYIPLIVDNTFATPYFCKPFEFGASIVTHSSTKYLDGHALQVSGMIVDSGRFNWKESYEKTGRFKGLVEPDLTYKGISYVDVFKNNSYIVKARVQLMRDLGATPSPFSAFLLCNGMQTLPLRMQKHFENALQVAQELKKHPLIEKVNFPALKDDPFNNLFQKYTPNGTSGVLSFVVKSKRDFDSREVARRVINNFKLVNIEVNVAEIRSCAIHPATSTHRQMNDDELKLAGIEPGLVRLSVGLENICDIMNDVLGALGV